MIHEMNNHDVPHLKEASDYFTHPLFREFWDNIPTSYFLEQLKLHTSEESEERVVEMVIDFIKQNVKKETPICSCNQPMTYRARYIKKMRYEPSEYNCKHCMFYFLSFTNLLLFQGRSYFCDCCWNKAKEGYVVSSKAILGGRKKERKQPLVSVHFPNCNSDDCESSGKDCETILYCARCMDGLISIYHQFLKVRSLFAKDVFARNGFQRDQNSILRLKACNTLTTTTFLFSQCFI